MEGVELCRNSCNTADCKSSPCEPTPRAARRRRMEIRRFKLIASSGSVVPVECSRKRLKLTDSADSFVVRDCANAVESLGRSHASGVQTLPFKDSQNEVNFTRADNTGCDVNKDDDKPPGGVQSGVGLDDRTYCRHGMVSLRGRRREMEDAVTILPAFASCTEGAERGASFNFYGVYDGHGGSQAALFCKDRLHSVLAEEMQTERSINGGYSDAQWKKMMKSCFLRVDTEVIGLAGDPCYQNGGQSPSSETVGSTAVVAVVGSDQIIVANCGDSRAVLCRGGKPVVLSADHKPERPDEMARIEAAGGRVIFWNGYRVLGVLAMSRAIGDKYLKPYVIGEPETTYTQRTDDDECLILASDGLWDVVPNELACEIASKCLRGRLIRKSDGCFAHLDDDGVENGDDLSPSATAAALLAKLAMVRGSPDNISVVVVDLKWHRHPHPRR